MIVIPHYGEAFYSWITNTVKVLNRGNFKLLCLEKDTYFTLNENKIEIIGSNNVHIIFKDKHDTYKHGDILDKSELNTTQLSGHINYIVNVFISQ